MGEKEGRPLVSGHMQARKKPDENLLSLLIVVEYHAQTLGKHTSETVWRTIERDIPAAHRERQDLLMAYEDRADLLEAARLALDEIGHLCHARDVLEVAIVRAEGQACVHESPFPEAENA